MAVAWYIVPMERVTEAGGWTYRRCAMCNHNAAIWAGGGKWSEVEILGGHCVVKVDALPAVHAVLAVEYFALPTRAMDTSLSDLSGRQKRAIADKLTDLGYSLSEIRDRLGNDIGSATFRDLLRFCATRVRKPEDASNPVVPAGEVRPCRKTIEQLDAEVR